MTPPPPSPSASSHRLATARSALNLRRPELSVSHELEELPSTPGASSSRLTLADEAGEESDVGEGLEHQEDEGRGGGAGGGYRLSALNLGTPKKRAGKGTPSKGEKEKEREREWERERDQESRAERDGIRRMSEGRGGTFSSGEQLSSHETELPS